MLLLILPLLPTACRITTHRVEATLILRDSAQRPLTTGLTVDRAEQTRTRFHIEVVVEGNTVVIAAQVFEELRVSAVKLRALEPPELIVHHTLSVEVVIDLQHVFHRFVGRPRMRYRRTGPPDVTAGRPRFGGPTCLYSTFPGPTISSIN